jgi:hypothetical protein
VGTLNPISAKKLEQLRAAGQPRPYSTLAAVSPKRAAALAATGKRVTTRKPARYTGPDKDTVDTVWARDEGRCGWCGRPVNPHSTRGFDWSMQHRRPRRRDGERPDTNLPSNLELLHGSGTTLCHGEVENQRRADAIRRGHLLHADGVPSQQPIDHAIHGWCHLTDDGAVTYAAPPVDRGDRIDFGGYWDDETGAA